LTLASGGVRVTNTTMVAMEASCVATATGNTTNWKPRSPMLAAASVGGIAVANAVLSPISLIGTTMAIIMSSAQSDARIIVEGAFTEPLAGSSVSGVGIGQAYTSSPVTIGNTTMVVGYRSDATSTAISSITTKGGYSSYSGSSVSGVSIGLLVLTSAVSIGNNTTMIVESGVVTSIATASAAGGHAWSGSSVCGLGIGYAVNNCPISIGGGGNSTTTMVVGCGSTAISTVSANNGDAFSSYSGSSVGGLGIGVASVDKCTIVATTLIVGHSNAMSTTNTTGSSSSFSGSSVGGVGIGWATSPVSIGCVSMAIRYSNATSTAVSNTTTSGGYSSWSGSSVGGVGIGFVYSNSDVSIGNATTMCVGHSNVTSSAISNTKTNGGHAYSGSSVSGVGIGYAYSVSSLSISATTLIVGSSDAMSVAISNTTSYSAFAGSSVSGVGIGLAESNCPVSLGNTAMVVGYSNATSTAIGGSTTGGSFSSWAGSTVGGVGIGESYGTSPLSIGAKTTMVIAQCLYVRIQSLAGSRGGNTFASSAGAAVVVAWLGATSACTSSPAVVAVIDNSFITADATSTLCSSGCNSAAAILALRGGNDGCVGSLNITQSLSTVSACAILTGTGSRSAQCLQGPPTSSVCCGPTTSGIAVLPAAAAAAVTLLPAVIDPPIFSGCAFIDGRSTVSTLPSNLPQWEAWALSLFRSQTMSATDSASTSATVNRSSSRSPTLSVSISASVSVSRLTSSSTISRPSISLTSVTATLRPMSQGSVVSKREGGPLTQVGLSVSSARAITSAAYGSNAAASALSPTAGNKQVSVNRVVISAQCVSLSKDTGFPTPDAWSMLPSMPVLASNDVASEAAGNVLSTTLYVIVAAVACVAATTVPKARINEMVAVAHAVGVTFFGPTILGTSVTLMRFPGVSAVGASVGAVAGVTMLVIATATCWACHRRSVPCTTSPRTNWIDRLQGDVLASFYEGARDKEQWYIRMHVFEDIAAAYVTAALGGLYPSTTGGCTAVSITLLAVAVAHVVYVLTVKPYRLQVEQWLSVINASIFVCIAVCALWARLSNDTDGTGSGTLAMGYCLLAANGFYFVQLIALAASGTLQRRCCHRPPDTTTVGIPLLACLPASDGNVDMIPTPLRPIIEIDTFSAPLSVQNPLQKTL
jgi:hypothetical protein